MHNEAYIEHLRICPFRPPGPLPRASGRLLEMVREFGAIEPVVVRKVADNQYEILGNIETWVAAQRLRMERVPIHVLENVSDEQAAEIVQATSSGFAVDPIDEAEFFNEQLALIEEGGSRYRTVAKLAYLTGHSRTYISHSVRLLKLPEDIQEMLRAGQLSAGHARALVGVTGRSVQLRIAKKTINEQLSVRQVEELAREYRSTAATVTKEVRSKNGAVRAKGADIIRLERVVSDLVGCRFEIQAGKAVFDFYGDMDILQGILTRIGYQNG